MSTRIMTPHCRPRLARALAAALCVLAAFSGTAAAQDVQQLVGQVSQASYRHFLDDLLYTHLNDSRALGGPQHDPARTNIVNALAGFGLEVRLQPFTYSYGTHYNVVGVLRGTVYPERQYVVGAHYDTVNCPGANDNGSGVAALLEAARVLSQGTFEATIVFIAFDREEQHIVGSTAYAREHAAIRSPPC